MTLQEIESRSWRRVPPSHGPVVPPSARADRGGMQHTRHWRHERGGETVVTHLFDESVAVEYHHGSAWHTVTALAVRRVGDAFSVLVTLRRGDGSIEMLWVPRGRVRPAGAADRTSEIWP